MFCFESSCAATVGSAQEQWNFLLKTRNTTVPTVLIGWWLVHSSVLVSFRYKGKLFIMVL